jgi:transposase-like protein
MMTLNLGGYHYSDREKEDAFRLWVELGRSFRLVAERLQIPDRTLRDWAKHENWEQKRSDLTLSVLPGMLAESAIALRMAGHSVAVRFQQIANDALDGTPPSMSEVKALSMILFHSGVSLTKGFDPQTGLVAKPASLSDAGKEKLLELLGLPSPTPPLPEP